MSRTPRSHLAIDNAHRSGGPATQSLVALTVIGDRLAEGAVAVNARRVVTYVNRAACGLLGVRAESVVGRDVLTLAGVGAAGEGRSRFERALATVRESGAEQVLTVNDVEAPPPFNVDYCRILPIADGGALILLGEVMSPSVSEQLNKARSLAEALQQINQSLELERVVLLIARHATDLLGARGARVMTLDGETLVTAAAVGAAIEASGTRRPVRTAFAGDAVRARRAVRTNDLGAPDRRDDEEAAAEPGQTRYHAVAAPLLVGDRPVGAVLVLGTHDREFSEHDEQLLITLATHGAIAIENARLYRAAAQTARHAGILAATAHTLAYNVTPASLYAGIARVVTESLRADGFSIYAADADRAHAEVLHAGGLGAEQVASVADAFWRTLGSHVIRTALPHFIGDASTEASSERPALPKALLAAGVTAMALLPLIVEGRARGLLVLRFGAPRQFDEPERSLLCDFATQVAVAMRNASLFSDLERRAARLTAVAKVQLAISQTELADVYAEIHRAVVSSVLDAPCFALLIADEMAPLFRPQLVVVDGVVTWSRALPPVPFNQCAASTALRTGRPVSSDNPLRSWAEIVPGATPRMPVASELAVPVSHGDRTLGVLIVQAYRRGVFTAEDVELLSIIARQAGAAIDNARLFEAQRTEREIAEAAARIARVTLGSTTTADAAAAILEVLDEVVPSAGKAIGIVTPDDEVVYVGASGSSADARGRRLPLDESIAARALVLGDAVVAGTWAPEEREPDDGMLARGGVVLPLAAQDRTLGVLAAAGASGSIPDAGVDALRRLAASVALAIDVQLLGEGERRQRERERMLATALATMDQPVFVLSLDRRVRYANDAAVREYGYSQDELTGMSIDALVASAVPVRRRSDEAPPPANVFVAEHIHRRKSGSHFPASVALSFIREERGSFIGQVLTVRNLTDERRIAEQLRQSEKLAALGELVAGVAHELNNPLAGISAFAQLLLEEDITDDQRESARLIKRESDRAVSVIRDLLLFSRKSGPSVAPVDLNALVQLTLRLRAYSLRSSGVEVDAYFDPALPEVAGDDQKLQQVLLNLIVNAEYAMRHAAAKRLIIRTSAEPAAAVIEISDTGSGMSKETQQRIFEPFFTTKPAGEGTGLGLSVSYGIIEAHGGTIAVESVLDRGTTFRVTLPVPPNAPDGSDAMDAPTA